MGAVIKKTENKGYKPKNTNVIKLERFLNKIKDVKRNRLG